MTDFTLSMRLLAKADGFTGEVGKAKAALADVGKAAEAAGKSAAELGNKLGDAGGKAGESAGKGGRAAADAFNAVEKASRAAAGGIKLQAYQVTNLGYQLQDIAVQLAGGQSPFMVMMQQVPQAAGAVGGFANLFRLALSPAVVGVYAPLLAVAGATALVMHRVVETGARTRELTGAMKAMGDVAGVTGEQLRRMSEEAAASGPFSRGETFTATKALSQHRRLSGDQMKDILGLGVNLAAATGQELAQVTETIAKAFEGGYAAIRQLDDAMGFLTRQEAEQIRSMAEHGRQAEALQVAMDALKRRAKGLAEDGLSEAAKATRDLGNAWNEMLDKLAATPLAQGAVQLLADMAKTAAWAVSKAPPSPPMDQAAAKNRELLAIEAQLSRGGSWERINQLQDRARQLRAEIEALTDKALDEAAARNAASIKKQAEAAKAAVETSAKALADILDEIEDRRKVLAAPAPERARVQAGIEADKTIREKQLIGNDAESARDALTGLADSQQLTQARDATAILSLQAAAQDRLAQAAGRSGEAMRRAAVANQIALLSYQANRQGIEDYTKAAWAAFEAEGRARRADWARQTDMQAAANDRLATAYRSGSAQAVETAERQNEIAQVLDRMGGTAEEAARHVDRLRDSQANLASGKTLADLRRDLADAEALTRSLASYEPAAVRQTQIEAATTRFANDNRLGGDDPKVIEFRALQQRKYADELARSAIQTNLARDASARYAEEMARLNDMQATGILSAEAYKEEWKRIEREKLEASRDFADGAKRALWDYADEAGNAAKQAESLVSTSLKAGEDGFVRWAKTGKANISDLFSTLEDAALRAFYKIAIYKPMEGLLDGLFSGIFGGGGSSVGALSTPVATIHTGGVVGQSGLVARPADPALFATAPRYHSGGIAGLASDERPAILQVGEEVLRASDPRHVRNIGRAPRTIDQDGRDAVINLKVEVIVPQAGGGAGAGESGPRASQGSGGDAEVIRILVPAIRRDLASRGELARTFEGTYVMARRRAGG